VVPGEVRIEENHADNFLRIRGGVHVREQAAERASDEKVRPVDVGCVEQPVKVLDAAAPCERTLDRVASADVGAVVHADPIAIGEQVGDKASVLTAPTRRLEDVAVQIDDRGRAGADAADVELVSTHIERTLYRRRGSGDRGSRSVEFG
jgi:hypothetical protein